MLVGLIESLFQSIEYEGKKSVIERAGHFGLEIKALVIQLYLYLGEVDDVFSEGWWEKGRLFIHLQILVVRRWKGFTGFIIFIAVQLIAVPIFKDQVTFEILQILKPPDEALHLALFHLEIINQIKADLLDCCKVGLKWLIIVLGDSQFKATFEMRVEGVRRDHFGRPERERGSHFGRLDNFLDLIFFVGKDEVGAEVILDIEGGIGWCSDEATWTTIFGRIKLPFRQNLIFNFYLNVLLLILVRRGFIELL